MTASDTISVYARLLALPLVLLALAGCGGGDDEPAADEPQQTGAADGFAAYEVESGGFTLSVPEEWKTAKIDEILNEGGLDKIRQEDPELAQQVEPFAQPGSPVKFVALDPDVQGGFATNVNVYVEEVPDGVTRDQYFEASLQKLTDAFGAPEQERVSLPGGEAVRVSYEQEIASGRKVAIVQYILFEEGTGYVLTYSTLPERSAEYADTFETSAESFDLL